MFPGLCVIIHGVELVVINVLIIGVKSQKEKSPTMISLVGPLKMDDRLSCPVMPRSNDHNHDNARSHDVRHDMNNLGGPGDTPFRRISRKDIKHRSDDNSTQDDTKTDNNLLHKHPLSNVFLQHLTAELTNFDVPMTLPMIS
jgi:hypothetical protein